MALIVKIAFLAGDLEGLEYQYLKKNRLRCMNKFFGAPKLYLTDIISAEVISEESAKKLGGTVGGALVGGALFGGVGAIVGAIGSGQTTETTILVTFQGGKQALARANSPMMDAIRKHLFNSERNPGHISQENAASGGGWGKKILITIGVLLFISALSSLGEDGGGGVKTPATGQVEKDQCANIKTSADWNNASVMWKLSNQECNPRKKKI